MYLKDLCIYERSNACTGIVAKIRFALSRSYELLLYDEHENDTNDNDNDPL